MAVKIPPRCPNCGYVGAINYWASRDEYRCGACRAGFPRGSWTYGIGQSHQAALSNPTQAFNASVGAIAAQQANLFSQFAAQLAAQNQSSLSQLGALQNVGIFGLGPPSFHAPAAVTTTPLAPTETCFGEIVGWRIWRLNKGFLQSYSADAIWAPGEPMVGKPSDHGHEGIWAFKSKTNALKKMLSDLAGVDAVLGSVEMWGEVVEHSIGYRAEYAEVSSIDAVVLAPTHNSHRVDPPKIPPQRRGFWSWLLDTPDPPSQYDPGSTPIPENDRVLAELRQRYLTHS